MRYWKYLLIVLIVCIASMELLIGCEQKSNTNDLDEVHMENYYCKEDFETITIGESTYQDVYSIAPPHSIQITSYGAFCEYPTQTGGHIRIKFYGQNLIVGAIEEVISANKD